MIVIDGERYLEADEAAARLGVKPETLYAYVSRGRLRSFRRAVGRGRLYLERDVERLLSLLPARMRGRPASLTSPPAATEVEAELPQADAWAAER
ncbi:MAG TPA: helix-turn-helix domain-containing protein [Dehalococcoidia bacterium]|nr:helix-turn-helix domain-containing protein [Dehalococcoidia bacterium]